MEGYDMEGIHPMSIAATVSTPPPLRRRATLSGLEKLRISAVLIVKDGEQHLDRVLSAVGFCDEILVLDSGSTDRTREICAEHNARWEYQEFLGYGPQKRRAVELAKHDWVLVIDDDEVLDYEAATTIQVLDYSDPNRAWRIRRRTYIGNREVRFGRWAPDYSLRLFNRTRAQFNGRLVHERVEAAGPVLTLQGSLHHYSFTDYADLFARSITYGRCKAELYAAQRRRAGTLLLILRAMWGFFRCFVIKRGFRDGTDGLMVALSLALDSVLGLALVEERERRQS
jgi:glycosyltransferase involved in cell wall biosynthesis